MATDHSTPQQVMTTRSVAAYLHIHPETVRDLTRRGELKAHRIGRHYRYYMGDVDEWLVNQ